MTKAPVSADPKSENLGSVNFKSQNIRPQSSKSHNFQTQNPRYLIIGDGRVAKHFLYYFQLLGIPTHQWSREQSSETLAQLFEESDISLLLISDPAIETFLQTYAFLKTKPVVHFSGSLSIENVYGCHPLSTFTHTLYDLDTYTKIPFICEVETPFTALFPQLENSYFSLKNELKPLYHALCVASGNFTTLLWQTTFKSFENELGLPASALIPYLNQITKNLKTNPEGALTGPLARRDTLTVSHNLNALEGNALLDIYKAFVSVFAPTLQQEQRRAHEHP